MHIYCHFTRLKRGVKTVFKNTAKIALLSLAQSILSISHQDDTIFHWGANFNKKIDRGSHRGGSHRGA